MEKRYVKFTAMQLRDLILRIPEIRAEMQLLDTKLRSGQSGRIGALIEAGSGWSYAYELSLVEHIALLTVALGLGPVVSEIAKAPDPQQALLAHLDDEPPEQHHSEFSESEIVGLVLSLGRSITSLMAHGRSLSSFVQEVRETGNCKALFEVVRIDRSALATPSIAARVSQAEAVGDEVFFGRLSKALKGPSKKVMRGHFDQMRWAFAALREVGAGDLSDEELVQLFVRELGVYPDVPSAGKNLRAHYRRSRALKTI